MYSADIGITTFDPLWTLLPAACCSWPASLSADSLRSQLSLAQMVTDSSHTDIRCIHTQARFDELLLALLTIAFRVYFGADEGAARDMGGARKFACSIANSRDRSNRYHLSPARMASELSQLIESELRKAEGANKPDEHQRRLTSLRVKVCSHPCAPLCAIAYCNAPRLCFCW